MAVGWGMGVAAATAGSTLASVGFSSTTWVTMACWSRGRQYQVTAAICRTRKAASNEAATLKVVPTGSWRIGESVEVLFMRGYKMPYPMSGERKSARTWASAGGSKAIALFLTCDAVLAEAGSFFPRHPPLRTTRSVSKP